MSDPRMPERHYSQRIGWLRAAVLGANDGIVSTASLFVGDEAGESSRTAVLVAGVAGLMAGAMSMAAGEYVSVSSQADTEAADLLRECRELSEFPESEREELRRIYVKRGLDETRAGRVAEQFMARDASGAHAHSRWRLRRFWGGCSERSCRRYGQTDASPCLLSYP